MTRQLMEGHRNFNMRSALSENVPACKVVDTNINAINCYDKNVTLLITLNPYRDYLFC